MQQQQWMLQQWMLRDVDIRNEEKNCSHGNILLSEEKYETHGYKIYLQINELQFKLQTYNFFFEYLLVFFFTLG